MSPLNNLPGRHQRGGQSDEAGQGDGHDGAAGQIGSEKPF